jgi:hypothetical protein
MVDVWKGSMYLVRSFWFVGWMRFVQPDRTGSAARSLKPRTPGLDP